MTIIDPFGGIGLGAIASHYGLNWLGNELEPRFCQMAWSWDCPGIKQEDYDGYKGQCESPQDWYKLDLGCCSECVYKAIEGEQPQPGLFEQEGYFTNPHRYHGNLERFKRYAQDGTWAKLTQGDSRKLNEIWAEGLVSSPPYANVGLQGGSSSAIGRLQDKLDKGELTGRESLRIAKKGKFNPHAMSNLDKYGSTDGQLANMSEGLVSSPPFAGNTGGKGKASRDGIDPALFDRHSGGMVGGMHGTEGNLEGMQPGGLVSSSPFASSVGSDDPQRRGGILKSDPKRKGDKNLTGDYGDSEGQLAGMGEGLVSSPPYENVDLGYGDRPNRWEKVKENPNFAGRTFWEQPTKRPDYNESSQDNIGNDSGPTFWQAASDIVQQCHSLLAPGSHCVWITKNYIKNGKEVDFTGNWQQLCISCGFEMVEEIQAMLVKNLGIQTSYSGDDHEITIARKSFFRRLAESKGAPPIDYETVTIMRRI